MYDFLLISAGFSSDIIAYFLAMLFIFLIFLVLTSSPLDKYNFLLAIMQQPAIRVQDTIREAA
jgi:hypothetical protein